MDQTPTADVHGPAPAAVRSAEWVAFSAAWQRCFGKILVVRLCRGRLGHRERARRRPATVTRWLALAYGPPLAALPLPPATGVAAPTGLLLLLGTVNAGMFAAAVLAWQYVLVRAHTIDALLRPCPHRDALPRLVRRAGTVAWQAPLPMSYAALPWLVGLAAAPSTWWAPGGLALVANLSWSMFLLGNVSYWLLVSPLLVVRIRSWRTLAMRWNDPARTPGIRTFSEGYAVAAFFLALGAVAVTLPGILGTPLFGRFLPFLYTYLLGLSLWVGVVTQVVIYATVRRFRLRLLDVLVEHGDFAAAESRAGEVPARIGTETANTLAVYGSVASAPGLPYGTALVVQYVAAIVGSVAGFLLQ